MRPGFGTVLALVVLTALAVSLPVHASDERHGPGVGSVALAGSEEAGADQRQPAQIQATSWLWIPPALRAREPRTPEPATENLLTHFPATAPPAAQPKADSLSNGIGIGALVGAGVGLGLVGWAYAQCDDTCDAPEPGGMYALGAGMGAAIGAAVGLVIDAARKNTNQRVSIAGSVAPTRSQVRLTVRW